MITTDHAFGRLGTHIVVAGGKNGLRMDAKEIGDRVRGARAIAGLSRADLAGRLGMSPNTLYKIETGLRQPHPGEVMLIAEVCGVPRWFLCKPWPDYSGPERRTPPTRRFPTARV